MVKFLETGSVGDSRKQGKPPSASAENIQRLRESHHQPGEVLFNWEYYTYKIQLVLEFNLQDFKLRSEFSRPFLNFADTFSLVWICQ